MAQRQGETPDQRADRNFDDLLQELRVSQNGTQILFAFLLTVPFSNGFKNVTSLERAVYFIALLLAGMSAAMLIAPATMHRILFRRGLKEELVEAATKVTLAGQVILIFAVATSVFLIGDYLYGTAAGLIVAIAMAGFWSVWFLVVPLSIRRSHHSAAADTTSSR